MPDSRDHVSRLTTDASSLEHSLGAMASRPLSVYLIATAAIGGALLLNSLGVPGLGESAPALLLTGVVLVVAVLGGWKAGAFAAALSTPVAIAFHVSADGLAGTIIFAALFLAECALVIALAEMARRLLMRSAKETELQQAVTEMAGLALVVRDDHGLFDQAARRVGDDVGAEATIIGEVQEGTAVVLASWSRPGGATPAEEDCEELVIEAASAGTGLLNAEGGAGQGSAVLLDSMGFRWAATASVGEGTRLVVVALSRNGGGFGATHVRYLEAVASLLVAAGQRGASERALERSEERLRVAQAAANIGTWEWDLETQRMLSSDGLELLHDLAPGSFPETAADYLALVHEDDRGRVTEAATVFASTGQFDARYRIVLPDGGSRWVSSRGKVFPGNNGRPGRVVGVMADISREVTVEDAVRASEDRLRMMANAAPVLMRVANPAGQCIFLNDRWAEFTGRATEELLGWGWLDVVHPDDREACRVAMEATVTDRTSVEFEYQVRDGSRGYRWLLDRTVPVEADDRTFIGFVSACTDITDRRRAEEALRFAADSGAQLATSLDQEETLRRLSQVVVPAFADWCVVFLKGDDGALRRASVVHRDPSQAEAVSQLALLDDLAVAGSSVAANVLRTGRPTLVRTVRGDQLEEAVGDRRHRELLVSLGIQSLLAVPLSSHADSIGVMVFVRGESGRLFDETDVTVAVDLGHRASISIENARLYSDLVEREAAVARANHTLRFLLDASAEMARTLDMEEMFASLVKLATPRIADWCVILKLDSGPEPTVVAASHRDPHWDTRVARLRERFPIRLREDGPILRALRDGVPAYLPVIEDRLLRALAVDEEHFDLIRELGLGSAVIVPLRGARAADAAMCFVMSESGRRYSEEDFAILQDLGHRAAVAMDNATLFREAQDREHDLRRANEAKDEFLGMMSHELRTPLTIINGGARVLRARASTLDQESRESILTDIETESDRLFRMVENLLSLAHLEFGEAFEVEPVHVTRLVEKVLTGFRARRPNREVILDVERGVETFAAQPVYLEQVVRNLLSNADKYSPQGVPISIEVRRTGEGVGEVRVRDRGVGIEPGEANLIFERFYRSERTSKLVGGSGVGLALCKRLIEAMSGDIWAQPREGGGLDVGFSLPLYEEAFV